MTLILNRRRACAAACATVALPFTGARAAGWPEKPISVLMPTTAGSSVDTNLRRALEEASRILGQPFVIENRPGAGGQIAMQAVARAKPDGYTLGLGNTASLAITPALNSKVGYEPVTDFEPISRFTSQPNLLVVRNDLPARTVAELTRHAKAHPGKLSMGSQGNGSSGHLSGELYKRAAQVEFTHVPYRGGVQAVQDLMGGLVDFQFENLATVETHVASGKMRALAVTSPRRNPRFPQIPTMQEAGFPGYEVVAWSGLVAPAKTPPEIVARVNRALNTALQLPGVRNLILERGGIVEGGTADAFRTLIASETVKWRRVVRSIEGLGDSAAR
jgi:tripartite-type tricarboxylate transporter receptor subunit TctC